MTVIDNFYLKITFIQKSSVSILLENPQHVCPHKFYIVVDCEDEHECKEDSSSTEKVPNVVAIKEIEKNAFSVHFPY